MNESNVVPLPEQSERPNLPATFDFMPRSLDEALRLADALAKSTILPKEYVDKPGNVLVAMQWGFELGLKPLQAMQNIAVINGKPGLYGDAGKALLITRGCTIIEDDARLIEDRQYATCTIKRPGFPDVTRTFSVKDAVTAGLWKKAGPWQTAPFRQMAWRAFWFAARDAAADILKGMDGAEALRDIQTMQERDVTAEGSATVGTGAEPAKKVDPALEQAYAAKIDKLCRGMDTAKTQEELDKLVAGVTLPEGEGKKKAAEHYRKAKLRIATPPSAKEPAKPEPKAEDKPAADPNMTTAIPVEVTAIIKGIANATNKEQADLAADLIRNVEDGTVQAELWEAYNIKVASFNPPPEAA